VLCHNALQLTKAESHPDDLVVYALFSFLTNTMHLAVFRLIFPRE